MIESGNLNVPEYLSTFSSLSLFNTTASERADIISSTNLSPRRIYIAPYCFSIKPNFLVIDDI